MDYLINGKKVRIKHEPIFGGVILVVEGSKSAYTRFSSYEKAITYVEKLFQLPQSAIEDMQIEGPVEKLERAIRERQTSNRLKALPEEEARKNIEEYLKLENRTCLCGCGIDVFNKSVFRPGHDQRIIGLLTKYQQGQSVNLNPRVFDFLMKCKRCNKIIVVNKSGICHHCSSKKGGETK